MKIESKIADEIIWLGLLVKTGRCFQLQQLRRMKLLATNGCKHEPFNTILN